MQRVFITGATGNVGTAVIHSLCALNSSMEIFAGIRDVQRERKIFIDYPVKIRKFDFTDTTTYRSALEGCQILFLLRPPQISDTNRYFKPLIQVAKDLGVLHIIFLSVQGVEKNPFIPHYKIEKCIIESGIKYTFLRPAYFMQNFCTTLNEDLVKKHQIFLPAGNAKFTLIDVRDIGRVAAKVITNIDGHINKIYELTSNDKLTFAEMAQKLSVALGVHIDYQSPNLFQFYQTKRKENVPTSFIFVMILLHYLPRFQNGPNCSDNVLKITQMNPVAFEQFALDLCSRRSS